MNKTDRRLMDAFGCGLQNKTVTWSEALTPSEWAGLFRAASKHSILPMVYDTVYGSPAYEQAMAAGERNPVTVHKASVQRQVYVQAVKTAEFMQLYRRMTEAGLKPLIVKGLVLRELYPKPDLRPSTDEDLLICANEFRKYHDLLSAAGLTLVEPDMDIDSEHEVSYQNAESFQYIEIHKSLFPPTSEAYGDLNRFFPEEIRDRAVQETCGGMQVWTLEPTDHLFYLITHAWKHFLHAGFGIRQIGDILLFSRVYEDQIDWERLKRQLTDMKGIRFTAALYRIGEKYLLPDLACYECVKGWTEDPVDEEPLLEDLLTGGIYGVSSMNRAHSSNITLKAAAEGKKGSKKQAGGKLRKGAERLRSAADSVFLPLSSMRGKYKYLEKYPILLPFAWVQRVYIYLVQENAKGRKDNNAIETLKVGQDRVDLLNYYDMI